MNIFYCGAVLWSGQPWIYHKKENNGNHIEYHLEKTLPIYISEASMGTLNLLLQLVHASQGQLVIEQSSHCVVGQRPSAILIGDRACYSKLIFSMRTHRWKLRDLADSLEMVLMNILQSGNTKSEILLQPPDQLEQIQLLEDIETTMAQYPLVKKTSRMIGISAKDYDHSQYMSDYILALQSKGYAVMLYVSNDDEYRQASQLHSDYIIFST